MLTTIGIVLRDGEKRHKGLRYKMYVLRGLTNVAMHEPDTWIIWLERDGQIATQRQKSHVPPWRIGEIERAGTVGDAVVFGGLSQYDEVVAVEVDGMGGGDDVLDGEFGELLAGDD